MILQKTLRYFSSVPIAQSEKNMIPKIYLDQTGVKQLTE